MLFTRIGLRQHGGLHFKTYLVFLTGFPIEAGGNNQRKTNTEAEEFASDLGTDKPLFSNRVVHTENN